MTDSINNDIEINDIMDNVIGVSKDGTNRIGQKHLEETMHHIKARSPIKQGILISQLRLKLLIGERYVIEYLEGLKSYEIIKIDSGTVFWNYKGNNESKEPSSLELAKRVKDYSKSKSKL